MQDNSLIGKVLEVATLNIISGKAAEFEENFKLARPMVGLYQAWIDK
jgi:hypothetical protein